MDGLKKDFPRAWQEVRVINLVADDLRADEFSQTLRKVFDAKNEILKILESKPEMRRLLNHEEEEDLESVLTDFISEAAKNSLQSIQGRMESGINFEGEIILQAFIENNEFWFKMLFTTDDNMVVLMLYYFIIR